MRPVRLLIFALVTLIVISFAGIFVKLRTPELPAERALFFPQLASTLSDVTAIEITSYAERISLVRQGNLWVINDFDGYPALLEKVKSAVIGVSELRVIAPKTADSQLYHRLGVEEPSIEDSTSVLLTLKDDQNTTLASLIVGQPRKSRAHTNKPGLYIRAPDSKQSYLVEGRLQISAAKTDWFDRTLFDIQSANISKVQVTHSDGDSYSVFRSEPGQDDFELEPVPAGKQAVSVIILNKIGSLLQGFHASGVRAQRNIPRPNESVDAIVSTFEGVIVKIHAFQQDGIAYAGFYFDFDSSASEAEEPSVQEELQLLTNRMNRKLSGWIFEIPDFKYAVLSRRAASLLADKSTEQEPDGS